ncbi:LysR substrate-binding domain-containing protein [Rodentibacter haemolyticus]|uniref:LysR substrate-binding domain-containing protein n=1 Tax=Rodentibacter haemolyticus TaxID=2778911 RepID=A0ABX6UXT6_9PAST|nr:LysR substrate-binding domain-containing protein [Rodentibacter haemolyticus]QPB42090.1 hypothetical protein IHV77_09210 [Rodentibacter haemolyticus]
MAFGAFELQQHHCLRLRLPTHHGLLDWQFISPDGKTFSPLLSESFISNSDHLLLHACRQDDGIMWIERSFVQAEIDNGNLESVLDDWAITYPLYYLYYPNRNPSPLLKALVEGVRV